MRAYPTRLALDAAGADTIRQALAAHHAGRLLTPFPTCFGGLPEGYASRDLELAHGTASCTVEALARTLGTGGAFLSDVLAVGRALANGDAPEMILAIPSRGHAAFGLFHALPQADDYEPLPGDAEALRTAATFGGERSRGTLLIALFGYLPRLLARHGARGYRRGLLQAGVMASGLAQLAQAVPSPIPPRITSDFADNALTRAAGLDPATFVPLVVIDPGEVLDV